MASFDDGCGFAEHIRIVSLNEGYLWVVIVSAHKILGLIVQRNIVGEGRFFNFYGTKILIVMSSKQ